MAIVLSIWSSSGGGVDSPRGQSMVLVEIDAWPFDRGITVCGACVGVPLPERYER